MNEIANIFLELKHTWVHLVPKSACGPFTTLERLFGTANSIMSLQVRDLVIESLREINEVFKEYKVNRIISKVMYETEFSFKLDVVLYIGWK